MEEHLIEFAANDALADEYAEAVQKHREKIRYSVDSECREQLTSEYPIIKTLEDSLRDFNGSTYDVPINQEVSWWIEEKIYLLCRDKSELSDKEIRAFINNFEWYNAIITLLIGTQDIFQGEFFSLVNDGCKLSLPTANIGLITDILDICNSIFGKTRDRNKAYKQQAKHLKKLQSEHGKFVKNIRKHLKNIFPNNRKDIGFLMGIEPILTSFTKMVGEEVYKIKPETPELYTQKLEDINRALTITVIKTINLYIEKFLKIEDKIFVKKSAVLLNIIGDKLMRILDGKKKSYFTENEIKGFLKKQ